jgi:16S rRNA (cytosine967-C5)-methyltransferase
MHSRDRILAQLGEKAKRGALTPWSIDVESPGIAGDLADKGLAVNQDEGSQLAILALDPRPGERVLDMCAGRGGKTSALAMAAQGRAEITAVDKSPSKLDRLALELAKQGFTAKTIAADLTENADVEGAPFDRILLDAPCSGSGTLGRRPEIRWRLSKKKIEELVSVQSGLLDRAAGLLKAKGRLVYSVCSILPEEGAGHLNAFLDRHPDFCAVAEPFPSWPGGVPWQNGSVFLDPADSSTDGYQLLVLFKKN